MAHMQSGYLHFCRRLFKIAYHSIRSRLIDLTFVIGAWIIGDYVRYEYTGSRQEASRVDLDVALSGWVPALVVLSVLLIFRVVLWAPYKLWVEEKTKKEQLQERLRSKLSTAFEQNNSRYITSFNLERNDANPFSRVKTRQICIDVKNSSGEDIDDMEVYCMEAGILSASPEIYRFRVFGIGENFRLLRSGEPLLVGLLNQVIEEDFYGHIIDNDFIVTVPLKCRRTELKGNQFFMKLLIVGRKSIAKEIYLRFGDQDGQLTFEIMPMMPPTPDTPSFTRSVIS